MHWIIKTEPNTYSLENLIKDKTTAWDGVRNYQARNNLSAMKKGDLAMVYHSVGPKTLVGIAKVVKTAYPDPTAKEGTWVCVDVKFQERLKREISLTELKSIPELSGLSLVKQGRLSVCPVSDTEWKIILALADH